MPTLFQLLSAFCGENNDPIPSKKQRCYIGREVLKKWRSEYYEENFSYTWSEEPTGRYQVIEYPPSFAPTIKEIIKEFFTRQSHRKMQLSSRGNNLFSKNQKRPGGWGGGSQHPRRSLHSPFPKACARVSIALVIPVSRLLIGMGQGAERLYQPIGNPILTLCSPSFDPQQTLTRGCSEGSDKNTLLSLPKVRRRIYIKK